MLCSPRMDGCTLINSRAFRLLVLGTYECTDRCVCYGYVMCVGLRCTDMFSIIEVKPAGIS
jgi:hypothetical protein